MKRTEVSFPCGDITLEGIWQVPDGAGKFPAVVICHPLPTHGGNMHNWLVSAVSRALLARSIAALRFNFRGTGNSGGKFSDGIDEQQDAQAALAFVVAQADIDPARLGLAGYSFGGRVSVPVAYADARVKALALIAPAIENGGWAKLCAMKIPRLLAAGSEDEFFPAAYFAAQFKKVSEPKRLQVFQGADHFFMGQEAMVAEAVGEFFKENL